MPPPANKLRGATVIAAQPAAPLQPPAKPRTVAEQLRVAAPRPEPKRNRKWENEHPSVTFRKVPAEIRGAVTEIAGATGYTVDQVAQAFLEYALFCHRRGELTLETGLGPNGVTLFPGGWSAEKHPIWSENNLAPKPPEAAGKKRRKRDPLWNARISYRLTSELNASLIEAGGGLPRGEVVARFLSHAIVAYREGRLVLRG